MMIATVQASAFTHSGLANAPIFCAIAREHDERKHGERQLQAEDHLAQDQQRPVPRSPYSHDDDDGRDDGDEPRDQPAQPRAQAQVDEAFHHDLAGERAGERGVLARAEQRHGEQHARHRRAEQRRQQLVRVADVGDVLVARCRGTSAAAMTRIAALMKSANISATDESMVAKRIASRLPSCVSRVLARLHDRRVQVEVVRHHRRAEDADGDVEHLAVARGSPARGMKPASDRRRGRACESQSSIANEPAMSEDQRDDERFDVAEAVVLQEEHDEDVERGEARRPR